MKRILTLAVAALTCSAMAQTTVTWDGAAGDGMYTNGGNWGGTVPADDLTTHVAQLTGGTVNLDTTRQVAGLDFASGSTLSGVGNLEIGTGGIHVGGNSILNTSGLVLNQADTTVTLNGGRLSWGTALTASGTGALTVTGNNTLYMDGGANTYAGGTTITGGATVSVKNGGALGAGALTLDNGTFSRNNANYNFGNDVVVNSGGGTININGNLTGAITGTGALTIVGQGSEKTITSDASGHSGGVTLDNTFYRTGNVNAYGTGAITLKNGATIKNNNNNLTFANDMVLGEGGGRFMAGWGRSITLNGAISGTGDLTILSDSGTVTLGNTGKTYTGNTIIEGKVSGRNGSFGDNATGGGFTFNGGTMVANHHLSLGTRAVTLDAGGGHVQVYNSRNLTIEGTVDGTGKLTVDDDGGTLILRGHNTYAGGTDINGNVQIDHDDSLGTGDILINNGGKLKNDDSSPTIANNVEIGSNGGILMAGWNKNLTIDGVVSGSGDLTIDTDSGWVVLNNANNTFDGNISFNSVYGGGYLRIASLAGGSYDGVISGTQTDTEVEITGQILLGGDSTFLGLLSVASGGAVGGSGSLAGNLTIDAGGQLVFSETDTLTVAGTVSLDNSFGIDDLIGISSGTATGTYTLVSNAGDFSNIENFGYDNRYSLGGGKEAYFQNGSLQVVVIPEPATLSVIAAAGAAMLFIRRRFMI